MIQCPLAILTNQPTATARKKCLVLQQSIAVETKSPIISISLSGDSPRNSSSHSPVWPAVNLPLKVILAGTESWSWNRSGERFKTHCDFHMEN